MKKQIGVFFVSSILSLVALGNDFSSQQPQVEVNQEIVEKIYRNALRQSELDSKIGKSGFDIVVGGNFFQASTMRLSNNYYDVSYSDHWKSIPMGSFLVASSFFEVGDFVVKGMGGFSYSYFEKVIRVTSKKSILNSERITNLRGYSIPIITGIELAYRHWLDFTPSLMGRVGAQWVYQLGTLDGIEQGFWVPFYQIGFGFSIFEPVLESDQSWFGGIKMAILSQRSLSASQTIEGVGVDLGIVLRL